MTKWTLNAAGLAILALLLALHSASVIDLGYMLWLVCAMIIVAAANIVVTPSEKDIGNG